MKRLILTADIYPLEENDSHVKYCHAIKTAYSTIWNVDYKYIQYKPNIEGRHSNWARIPMLHKFMTEYDEILWMDTDIVIIDNTIDFFDFFKVKMITETLPNQNMCTSALEGKCATNTACLYNCQDKDKFKRF